MPSSSFSASSNDRLAISLGSAVSLANFASQGGLSRMVAGGAGRGQFARQNAVKNAHSARSFWLSQLWIATHAYVTWPLCTFAYQNPPQRIAACPGQWHGPRRNEINGHS